MSTEEWTRAQCAQYWNIQPSTWAGYVSREQAPQPIRHVGRTPLWNSDDVRAWHRPGQGARTDRKGEMMSATPPPPLARAVHGRYLVIGGRAFLATHTDGYAHIDLLTRREPRFETDRDENRPEEWVRVERYVTTDIQFDAAAKERFDVWVEQALRPEMEKPGAFLQTYPI